MTMPHAPSMTCPVFSATLFLPNKMPAWGRGGEREGSGSHSEEDNYRRAIPS